LQLPVAGQGSNPGLVLEDPAVLLPPVEADTPPL